MKRIIIVMLLMASISGHSQKLYNMDVKYSNFPCFTQTQDSAIYQGIKYGVYKSRKGYLFIFFTKPNGRTVRRYIY